MTTEQTTQTTEASEQQVLVDIHGHVDGTYDLECMEFKMTPTCVVVKCNGVDKFISLDSFLSALAASSSSAAGNTLEGFLLPSNTFYFARSLTNIQLSCYYTGGIRNVKYYSSDRPSVVPNLIVSHTLTKIQDAWSVGASKYFVTDMPASSLPNRFVNAISPQEHIFQMCFTNTYIDGRMCYGGNSMPQVFRQNNFRGLDWYYQFLFETPFNDDLGLPGVKNRPSPSTWYTKLAELAAEGKPFPYQDLNGYE
jgi:hypothetical protein